MTKPVRLMEHTHNLTVLHNHETAALENTTVGRVYPAEVNILGGYMPDGSGYTKSPFITFVDDSGDVVVLEPRTRHDISLTPVARVPGPSVTVHEAEYVFRDCTPGKTYPAHVYKRGDVDPQGLITAHDRSLGFIDDRGYFVKQSQGFGLATLNWGA